MDLPGVHAALSAVIPLGEVWEAKVLPLKLSEWILKKINQRVFYINKSAPQLRDESGIDSPPPKKMVARDQFRT